MGKLNWEKIYNRMKSQQEEEEWNIYKNMNKILVDFNIQDEINFFYKKHLLQSDGTL